jgi:hypothetical protein
LRVTDEGFSIRASLIPENHNYPGFPDGISGSDHQPDPPGDENSPGTDFSRRNHNTEKVEFGIGASAQQLLDAGKHVIAGTAEFGPIASKAGCDAIGIWYVRATEPIKRPEYTRLALGPFLALWLRQRIRAPGPRPKS